MRRKKRRPRPFIDAIEKYQVDLSAIIALLIIDIFMVGRFITDEKVRPMNINHDYYSLSGEPALIVVYGIFVVTMVYGIITGVRVYREYNQKT